MKKEEKVWYKVKSLKRGMTHMATESAAISILALLLFIGAPSVFPTIIDPYKASSLKIMQGIIIVPLAFWAITIISNLVSCIMIFKLKRSLSSKKK